MTSADESADIRMEGVLVTGVRDTDLRSTTETHHLLSADVIARLDATSGADILRRIPGVHVPTNSRGESIVFLRNAGERQAVVFLDGAMLNVPWDNRFDTSMLPGYLVGSVVSASGPLSTRYGVNALGAVNVLLPGYPNGARLISEWGEENLQRYEGQLSGNVGEMQLLGAATYASQDGEPVADPKRLPFFQNDPDRRTNTDREFLSAAGRAGVQLENGRIDATLIFSDGEKGVAPESHLASGNRFWRYPEHQFLQSNLHADIDFAPNVNFTAAAWAQDFVQTIEQYADATYEVVRDREEDKDRTYGTRGILTSRLGEHTQIALSYNVLVSTHVQRDTRLVSGALPSSLPPWLSYRQRAISAGADIEYRFTDTLVGELGGGIDWLAYTRTGDKPSIDDFVEPTAHGGLAYSINTAWRLRVGAGYKTRSPTMRDLFGVALTRFLLNPDLTAERITNVEAAAEWRTAGASFAAIPFAQFVDNTIDQRNVGALRQRVNLRGSRIYGIELAGHVQLSDEWSARGTIMGSHVRRLRGSPTESEHLAEKPELLVGASIDYSDASGFEASVELYHLGRAYSADATGALVPLDTSTQFSARLALNLDRMFAGLPSSQLYLRVDNVTDTFVEPQLGLPAPERWIRGGLRVQW